jgi:hypothetical protein
MEFFMPDFLHRLPLSLILALLVYFGLHLAGVNEALIFAAVTSVAVMLLLQVFTEFVIPFSTLALLWGMLARAGVAPAADVAQEEFTSMLGMPRKEIQVTNQSASLDEKLTQLKIACDHKALSSKECNDARSQIVAEFSGKP